MIRVLEKTSSHAVESPHLDDPGQGLLGGWRAENVEPYKPKQWDRVAYAIGRRSVFTAEECLCPMAARKHEEPKLA
jgi:hypothetical protein